MLEEETDLVHNAADGGACLLGLERFEVLLLG